MGLFDFLARKHRGRTMILVAAMSTLDHAMDMASPFVHERVKRWDLEDPTLLITLGYLSGYIDAAYQLTKPFKYDEKLVDSLFVTQVAKHLTWVPGVEVYLAIFKTGHESGIGAMQCDPKFMEGAMAGGNDFVNFANDKRMPISLVRLLQENPA